MRKNDWNSLFIYLNFRLDIKLNKFLRPANLKEAVRQIEKMISDDQT